LAKFLTSLALPAKTYGRGWGKMRLLSLDARRKGHIQGPDRSLANLGVLEMSFRKTLVAAAALGVAALASTSFARAADLPVKAAKPPPDVPFFPMIDERVTCSYIFDAKQPGMWSTNPNGTVNSNTAKQAYSFTHFDLYKYGTNFLTLSLFKSAQKRPSNPCFNAAISVNPFGGITPANCAGASEIYGLFRST